jgi:hypothetical protein
MINPWDPTPIFFTTEGHVCTCGQPYARSDDRFRECMVHVRPSPFEGIDRSVADVQWTLQYQQRPISSSELTDALIYAWNAIARTGWNR